MQVTLSTLVRSILKKHLFAPLLFLGIVAGGLLFSLLVGIDRSWHDELLRGNVKNVSQMLLAGDSPGLKRQLEGMAKIGSWANGAILYQNNMPIATYGEFIECENRFELESQTGLTDGFICFQRSFLVVYGKILGLSLFIYLFMGAIIFWAVNKTQDQLKVVSANFEKLASAISNHIQIQGMDFKTHEELELATNFNHLLKNEKAYQEMLLKTEKEAALAKMASQVSHDIRSPLAALNLILGSLTQVSEEKRVLIRSAVQRINDIANQLLEVGKKQRNQSMLAAPSKWPVVLLSSVIDYLLSEKRVQFREKANIQIEGDLNQGYGLFSKCDPNEIKTVLSNLINNSIEAFVNETGKVTVSISDHRGQVTIMIQDNGKGIPKHILDKLGQQGVSHGKEGTQSGSGLGVFHAKQTIEALNGHFTIQSKLGQGTTITISLPKAESPKWFVDKIELAHFDQVVALDDDISIHGIWRGRLSSINSEASGISMMSFTSGADFKSWVLDQPSDVLARTKFLIDYELLNQVKTGLDLIEELKIQATLVTSRYEEKDIITKCESLGVGIIPKGMAGLVPLKIKALKIKYDAVLIDDDSLVHQVWNMAASEKNKLLRCFFNFEDFLKEADDLDRSTEIYVDANLGDGIRGEVVASRIFALGFKGIFIATGYAPDEIVTNPSIKGVVGKEPPF
jgi:signal transduction histidine kinase